MRTRGLAACLAGLTLLVLVLAAVSAGAEQSETEGAPHLLAVPADGPAAVALARSDARVIVRYRAFTLVEAAGADAERLHRAGSDLRDDMREVRVGRTEIDPARDRRALGAAPGSRGLALVQFIGPIKDVWLERVRATGVRIVTYMAENGYLVSGSAEELASLGALRRSDPAVRAVVSYTARDKLGAGMRFQGRQRLAVQTLSGAAGAAARSRVEELGREPQTSAVGAFRTQYAVLGAQDVAALASDPGVLSIQPAPEPVLLDERADQIVAGALTGPDPLVPTGPGYLAFYDGLGLGTTTFPFTVDVTDEGIDTGSVNTALADFHVDGVGAQPTRITYADDRTSDPAANDCGGHGTINASIIAGFNDGTGAAVEDAGGFQYGLGVAPRARVGATKIFRCAGSFGLIGSLTEAASNSYANGARIANHSWGANTGGAYVADAQEFDAIVRDSQPGVGTPGNQELVEVVSAGNAGSGANTIGSVATAKNVIAVGASESTRASGTDGCGVTNSGSDDAHDIVSFSSRGPTDDGRTKPDIVGPGTHITGAQSQAAGYTGSGVCDAAFPSGSTLYNISSGTSHSSPVVAGMAALFREWSRQTRGGALPSPALTRAALAGAATDIAGGDGVGGNLPNSNQGWGLGNIARLLDSGPRFLWDQQTTFTGSGDEFRRTFAVQDPSKPVRVTLAWTDPPGPTIGNSFVNNLDLGVDAAAGDYKGNVFSGGASVPGGTADPRNNLEGVYLPSGASGTFSVSVTAANIAGDGVPGNADATDQDFALVVSNAAEVTAPVLKRESSAVTPFGDGDSALEPGERFTVSAELKNTGTAPATGIGGALSAPASVRRTDPFTAWPDLGVGATAANSDPILATLRESAGCGTPVQLTLAITGSGGSAVTIPFTVPTGAPGPPVGRLNADGPKAIPDNFPTGVTSVVNVGAAGTITDLDVRIAQLTHTWVGDLKLELTSPSGTTVVLADRPGGIGNNGDNLTNTVLNDEAATALSAGSAPYTGNFRPVGQLSSFDSEPQQGTWTLKVADLAANDTGTLSSWGHDIRIGVCDFVPPPAPAQPTGLVATPGADSVSLDWSDVPAASGYEVFRRRADGTYSEVPTALPTSSDFVDAGRTPGQQYCYVVGATTGGSPGPTSDEACATIPSGGGGGGGGDGLPTLNLSSLRSSIRVGHRGAFLLTFAATPPGQAGSIKLTTVKRVSASRRRRLAVARKSFTVPASGRVRVKLKLGRRGFRVLKRAKRLPVSAKVTLGPTTASKRVTLRAPRARPRR